MQSTVIVLLHHAAVAVVGAAVPEYGLLCGSAHARVVVAHQPALVVLAQTLAHQQGDAVGDVAVQVGGSAVVSCRVIKCGCWKERDVM